MASTTALTLALVAQLAAPTHAPGATTSTSPASTSTTTTMTTARVPSPAATVTRPSLPHDTVHQRPRLRAQRLSPRKRKASRAFFAAGCVILGVFYLGGTFAAATQIDQAYEDGMVESQERDQLRVSRLMFVPVVGPLVGSPWGQTKGDRAALVGFGLMQGLGVAYMATGGVMLARDARARRLELGALPTRGGAALSLRGRF